MQKDSCVFCRIVRKEAPASVVYEDERVMAFMDTRPVSEGHTLVITKKHYDDIYDIPEELAAYLHKIVKRTSVVLGKVMKADGISIVQQNGRAAGQEIFHLHVHIIPRYEGHKLLPFGGVPESTREKLDQTAERIRLRL
jgi:histidine triad (HIT) family protein